MRKSCVTAHPETIHPVDATKSNSRITAHPECWRALALVCPHAIESTAARHLWASRTVAPKAYHTACRRICRCFRAASNFRSLPAYSASVASSCVRSIILMGERFLHFQLNRKMPVFSGLLLSARIAPTLPRSLSEHRTLLRSKEWLTGKPQWR